MNFSASQSLLRAKVGRVYIPPLAVLYLYSITSNIHYGYIASAGVVAAVSFHALNMAVFGPDGSFSNMDAQDEKFARRLIAVMKRGKLEEYPQSMVELCKNPTEIPFDWKRVPTVLVTCFSGLVSVLVIVSAVIGFSQNYSSLDFVGLTLLFAMAVFLLQPVLWPLYWSVSNQRDKKHPPVDTRDHRKLVDFEKVLETNEGLEVIHNEYNLSKGGEVDLRCNAEYSDRSMIQVIIQTISFAYIGLVESTSLPFSKLKVTLIDSGGDEITFVVDRSLVNEYTKCHLTEKEYVDNILKRTVFPQDSK